MAGMTEPKRKVAVTLDGDVVDQASEFGDGNFSAIVEEALREFTRARQARRDAEIYRHNPIGAHEGLAGRPQLAADTDDTDWESLYGTAS